jgi:hypothetical protein
MRMLMKIVLPNASYNRAIAEGRLSVVWQHFFDLARPEATYYVGEQGLRAVHVLLDLPDTARYAALTLPLYQHLEAEITCEPALRFEDIAAASMPSH